MSLSPRGPPSHESLTLVPFSSVPGRGIAATYSDLKRTQGRREEGLSRGHRGSRCHPSFKLRFQASTTSKKSHSGVGIPTSSDGRIALSRTRERTAGQCWGTRPSLESRRLWKCCRPMHSNPRQASTRRTQTGRPSIAFPSSLALGSGLDFSRADHIVTNMDHTKHVSV